MSVIARFNMMRLVLVTGVTSVLVYLATAPVAFAARGDNVGQNLKDLAMGWIEPIFYVIVAGVTVLCLAKRKFPELLAFFVVAAVVAGPVFNPEGTKDLLLGISNTLSGDK